MAKEEYKSRVYTDRPAYEDFENAEKDYRCPICGLGIAEEYQCCPYCMSEFNWSKVKQPKSEEFRKLIDSI